MQNKTIPPPKDKYYLVLQLPLKLLLVHKNPFNTLTSAKEYQDKNISFFDIWPEEKFKDWGHPVLYIPLHKSKRARKYTISLRGELTVEANSEKEALSKAAKLIDRQKVLKVQPEIKESQENLDYAT